MFDEPKTLFKNVRVMLINFAERIIRKSGLSDQLICTLLRCIHFVMPVITVIILLLGPKEMFITVVFFNVIVFILFFLFDGCILSRIERCFTDDTFTVIDPFLMLINVELTNDNRTIYSIYSSLLGFILTYIIYLSRFGNINFSNINFGKITSSNIENILDKNVL